MAHIPSGENFIVTQGFGGNTQVLDGSNLIVTHGFGSAGQNAIDDLTGPGGHINDHVARGLALFVTQFRQLRDDIA